MSARLYLALGPGCWATDETADAARCKALRFGPRGVRIREIGVYRLPEGASAHVNALGQIVVLDGDGSTPEHVKGPRTIDW